MDYKLLALDIDGTLLNSQSRLTERTILAVHEAKQAGLRVCLASGRRARTMRPFAERLGIMDPLVSLNGGAVVRPDNLEVLHAFAMPKEDSDPIARVLQEADIAAFATRNSAAPPDVFYQMAQASSEWSHLSSYIESQGAGIRLVHSLADETDWDPLRIYVAGEQGTTQRAMRLVLPLIDQTKIRVLHTMQYDGTYFLEMLPVSATKANGLRFLGEFYGVKREEVIAVGDQINDLDMLEYAGLGVAMGNAQPEVKAKADLVIGHHDEDGLAAFIEEKLLAG